MIRTGLRHTLLLLVLVAGMGSCDTGTDAIDENGTNGNGNGNGNYADEFSHTLPAGDSALDFLQDEHFNEIVVEIDFMPDAEPTTQALDSLTAFLEKWTLKSVSLETGDIPSGGQDAYSANEIRTLEEEHRTLYAEGNTLAVYCIFVDGEFSQSENVIGIAYYNTSCAIFGATVDRVTGFPTDPSREKIEGTVLNHEIGHLLGLVNNGTETQQEHHDSDNGAHCTNQECLMYYSVRTTGFFEFFDNSIPELDAFCEEDIRAVQGS